VELLRKALTDKFPGLREFAIGKSDLRKEAIRTGFEPILAKLAKEDPRALVRAAAIQKLGEYRKAEYAPLFNAAIKDSSYTVAGNALNALQKVDADAFARYIKELSTQKLKGALQEVVMAEIYKMGDESMAEKVIGDFGKMPLSQAKFQALNGLATYLAAIKDPAKVKWGVEEIVKLRDGIPEGFRNQTDPFINGMVLKGLLADKTKKLNADPSNAGLADLVKYIKEQLPEEDKKGF
jgi:aminopeptidase N